MKTGHHEGHDQVFIVRCWNEAEGLQSLAKRWRLQVRHVNRNDENHFDSTEKLGRFIDGRLADTD